MGWEHKMEQKGTTRPPRQQDYKTDVRKWDSSVLRGGEIRVHDGSDEAGGIGLGLGIDGVPDAEEFAVEHANDIAPEFVGILMGKEPGLDVRTFDPFPELLFELLLGFGLKGGVEVLLFEVDAAREEFAAAEGDDVGEE